MYAVREKKRKKKTAEQALKILMWLCAKVEKSTGDARRLLFRWGVDPAEHQDVIDRLIEEKFIDDQRYATAYVREKLKLSGWGARKIGYMLGSKGVARDIIDRVLEEVVDADEMDERLEKCLEKKMRSIKAATPWEFRQKLVNYGLSQGYNYAAVAKAIKNINERQL